MEKEENGQTVSDLVAYMKKLCEERGIPLVIEPLESSRIILNPPRSLIEKALALKNKKAVS